MSPQTELNLEKAMAVEAFANAKYTRFAACARKNDNPELARLFQTTADLDRAAHFRREFDFAHLPCDNAENLQSAINDKESVIAMYSEFIRQAEAAGDYSAASLFESIRDEERLQVTTFREALDNIRSESRHEQTVEA